MKTSSLNIFTGMFLLMISSAAFAQPITLGAASRFVLFTSGGAVGDNPSSHSHLTGDLGYETSGAFSGFGNVNGIMHPGVDAATTAAGSALLSTIVQINNSTTTDAISGAIGNGDTLTPGVYSIPVDAVLNLNLFLNAQGNSSAEFIFKVGGTFSANTNAKIKLINGAQACHIFWKVTGTIDFAAGATLRGNFISGAAISMSTGDTLEGRALTTVGAINVDGVLAYMPVGCGSPVLTGPVTPDLGSTECFAIFSSSGAVSNSGVTHVTGDVGSNNMTPTDFVAQDVNGTIHDPDNYTSAAASDMPAIYNHFNTLPFDIQLLYPAQFGNNLVLTPHTYLLDEGTVFTDSLYLNAQGNSDAVFVIQVNGALSTTVNATVKLINGTQAKNVYWVVDGAVSILGSSDFKGTIVTNSGAIDLDAGTLINGRLLSISGEVTVAAITALMPPGCFATGINSDNNTTNEMASIYPNPFRSTTTITIHDHSQTINAHLRIYNALGAEVMSVIISNQTTTLETGHLSSGVYYYTLFSKDKITQSGKLVSQQKN